MTAYTNTVFETRKPHSRNATLYATTIAEMSYSHSKKWINKDVQEQKVRRGFIAARLKLCPLSEFLPKDLDIPLHTLKWEILKKSSSAKRASPDKSAVPLSREPFGNKTINGPGFIEDYSTVVCEKTVFTPYFADAMEFVEPWPIEHHGDFAISRPKMPKPIASWPKRDEMKYEGDDRVSTDRLHARCLALPRVSGNETVNWQHRARIIPSLFDTHIYVPCKAEVLERRFGIGDIDEFPEMDRKTPQDILGKELFRLLDPIDRL